MNEKIEGFYAACKSKGLNGQQGVVIPASNVRHLMLNDEVIQAVKNGDFHIWKAVTIDDAIRLMADLEPGERQADGSYPVGSFNQAVVEGLASLAEAGGEQAKEEVHAETEEEQEPGEGSHA